MSKVMTVSEAARELDVAAQTVREWADAGKLPVERTSGGMRLFRRQDVEHIGRERRRLRGEGELRQ